MATNRQTRCNNKRGHGGFQSIGVTKDWRQSTTPFHPVTRRWFPINRRHQGLATGRAQRRRDFELSWWFPINRRHQGLATAYLSGWPTQHPLQCFQSIGVTKDWRPADASSTSWEDVLGFQSIGVTKDWRPGPNDCLGGRFSSFQSIGVTKDWRP